jgi:hypothetical protein
VERLEIVREIAQEEESETERTFTAVEKTNEQDKLSSTKH